MSKTVDSVFFPLNMHTFSLKALIHGFSMAYLNYQHQYFSFGAGK
jgi:hypothetical protein